MFYSIVKWLFFSIINLIAVILNYPLAPIVVLFAKKNELGEYWLPWWLNWFQTPDNPLNGDHGWRTNDMPFLLEENSFQRWVNQFRWLHRNSVYGFNFSVTGCPIKEGFKLVTTGDPEVGNRPLVEGLVKRILTNPDGSIYWQIYYIKAWPCSITRCFRFNFGWKLWDTLIPGEKRQFVCSPSVSMSYTPK